jgi:hypothetical protein
MAAPLDKVATPGSPSCSDDVRQQLNNLITAFRVLTAKMDADAGVTDTNYTALTTDASLAFAPTRITLS